MARYLEKVVEYSQGWTPADMLATPATKAFQKKAADPILNFLVFLGEEYDANEYGTILDETPRTKNSALENVHKEYAKWCKRQHFKHEDVLGANDFKDKLRGTLEAAGVQNAYALRAGGPRVPVFDLARDGVLAVIHKNLDSEFKWSVAV